MSVSWAWLSVIMMQLVSMYQTLSAVSVTEVSLEMALSLATKRKSILEVTPNFGDSLMCRAENLSNIQFNLNLSNL